MSSLPQFRTLTSRERTLWVQHALRLNGSSFAAIGRRIGCDRITVARAMYQALDRQEAAIAEELGVSQQELFPERFDARGNRLHAVKNIPQRNDSNVKESEAA